MVAPRLALVTGAASGIGRALALALTREGWAVAGFDLRPEDLPELALAGRLDVREAEGWEAAVAQVRAQAGRLDLLVHNAGVALAGPLDQAAPEALRRVLDTNLLGPLLGTRAALPLLRETPGARVALVGSMLGAHGVPLGAAYAASKAGLRSLAESLALELAPAGLGLIHLMPGFVDTPMLRAEGEPPPGRLLAPEAVAEALLAALARGAPLHVPVGQDARWMVGLARWWPGLLRRSISLKT